MPAVPYGDEDLAPHARDALYLPLVSLPAALLGTAFLSDVLHCVTAAAPYARASEWLLAAGLATAAVSAAEGVVRYVAAGCTRPSRAAWAHVAGAVLSLLLTAANLIYRLSEGAATAVVPAGITLTAFAASLMVGAACLGRGSARGHPGADEDGEWDLV